MPRGDRTGPQGMGPQTGRGFGSCGEQVERGTNLAESDGFFRRLGNRLGFGRNGQGRGLGRSGGRGRRRR